MRDHDLVHISYTRLDTEDRWALTCSLPGKVSLTLLPAKKEFS
jgi:hypothetical protein